MKTQVAMHEVIRQQIRQIPANELKKLPSTVCPVILVDDSGGRITTKWESGSRHLTNPILNNWPSDKTLWILYQGSARPDPSRPYLLKTSRNEILRMRGELPVKSVKRLTEAERQWREKRRVNAGINKMINELAAMSPAQRRARLEKMGRGI